MIQYIFSTVFNLIKKMGKCYSKNNKKKIYEKTDENNKLRIKQNFRIPIIEFTNESLKKHNEYREKHNAEPLKLNNELQKYAQNHAEYMASNNIETHSSCRLNNKIIGESLYSNEKYFTGEEFTNNLYKDIKYYNFEKSKCVIKASRFTQLVWKNTKNVGFGFSLNKSNGYFFAVAIYDPPGNKLGCYKNNVDNKI